MLIRGGRALEVELDGVPGGRGLYGGREDAERVARRLAREMFAAIQLEEQDGPRRVDP